MEELKKFMQSLDDRIFKCLQDLADERGITVQEFIRAVIIPEWMSTQDLSLAAKTRELSEKFSGPKGDE